MSYADTFAGPIIEVNGFVFCKNHGDEWCHRCCYDHRMTNNYQIEDALPEEVNNSMVFDIENRHTFNAYACGAVPARSGKSDAYQCRVHDKIDCKTCFDWVGLVKKQAKEAADQEKWLNKRKKYLDSRDN
ncbi:hypothetical protein BJ912DRAFT_1059392 [Pholiota molesta]|nr:hypothetical protein BJ912DRAFT_1059392 [Pholiota molesta]